jgi:hypothetical protein
MFVSLILASCGAFDTGDAEVGEEHLFPHLGQNFHELDSNGAWHEEHEFPLLKLMLRLMLFSIRCPCCRLLVGSVSLRFDSESIVKFVHIGFVCRSFLHKRKYW